MKNTQKPNVVIDLGWCMARIEFRERYDPKLTIASPSSTTGETFYEPAESVTIYGEGAIIALRDALNAAFPLEHVPPAL